MSSYGGYIMFGLWRLWKRRNSLAVEIKSVQLMDTVMMLHNNRDNLKIQNQGKRCWSDTELPLFIFFVYFFSINFLLIYSIPWFWWVARDFAGIFFPAAGEFGSFADESSITLEVEAVKCFYLGMCRERFF